ncbi:gliding motility-associated C-terminal domain-containing protein [Salibacteraceae bacterium]|nr:gliding motility-associated C-terminal domain-containing protein [Salibacteraceae bacterium]
MRESTIANHRMKPGLFRILGLLVLLFIFTPKLKATHLAGGDISYTHIDGDTFQIKMNLYWDCGGSAGAPFVGLPTNTNTNNVNRQPPTGFGASRHNGTRITSSCGGSVTPTWILSNPGGTEISQLCADSITYSECGTLGGTLPGLELYTYIDTVVLSSCSNWTVSFVSFARNTSVNVSGSSGATMYMDASINTVVDSTNSTPIFSADPAPYYCQGQQASYDFQITDPDGDSLHAILESAKQITGGGAGSITTMSYLSPYSSAQPIANSTFNAATGVLTFTPATGGTNAGNFIVVIEVKDYDASGNVKSTVRRDFQVVTRDCGSNLVPKIKAGVNGGISNVQGGIRTDTLYVEVIEGDSLDFDLKFYDPGDSIYLSANNALKLSGSNFVTSTARDSAVGTISWRAGAASPTARTVTITAEDDNCAISGINSKTVKILVVDSMTCVGYNELAQSCSQNADGSLRARTSGGLGPYGFVWRKNGILDPSLTTRTITGIKSTDSYSVTVIDSFNNTTCALGSKNIAKVNEISVVPDSVFVTNLDCDGNCLGEIDIREVIGGTPTVGGPLGYSYSWSTTSDTTNHPDTLCAGRYFVTISDQRSCDTVYRFYVNGPPTFTASIVDFDTISCKGDSTGSATVRIDVISSGTTSDACDSVSFDTLGTGVTANTFSQYPTPFGRRKKVKQQYLYRVSELKAAGLSDGDKISNLGFLISADNFIGTVSNFELSMGVTSKDTLSSTNFIPGLFSVFDTVSLSVPLGVTSDTWRMMSLTNSFVWNGDSNIVVEVCFNNAAGSQIGASVRNTTTGTNRSYTVFESDVEDACLKDTVLQSGFTHPNLRFGVCPSEVQYLWTSGTSSYIDSTDINLWSATHFVTVTNEENCSDTASIFINEPAVALVATVDSVVNVNCSGDTTGMAFITASGGTGVLTFAWPVGVSTGASDSIGINLTSGITYVVTVTDANLCEDTASFTLSDLSNLVVDITDSVSIRCFGDNNGRLFATPDSGDLPYSYTWIDLTGGSTVSTLTGFDSVAINLSSGNYRIVVTDNVGCKDSVEANLAEPADLIAVFTDSSGVACAGDTNASLTVTPSGGTPGYQYFWFRNGGGGITLGSSDSIAIDLPADTFAVIVRDSRGCRDTLVREVTEPDSLKISFTDSILVSCPGGNDGSFTVTPTGGRPIHTYSWEAGVFTGSSDSIAINLGAGTYTVTVLDNNLCPAVDSATVIDPTGITVAFTDSTSVGCNGTSTGGLTATPSNGTGPYTWTWVDVSGGTAVSTGSSDSIAINLSSGTYRVIVEDGGGCKDSAEINLSDPAALNISIVDSSSVRCNGESNGKLFSAVTGGTLSYTFTWTPAVANPTADSIGESLSGNVAYEVLVVDANGCRDSVTTTLQDPTLVTATFTDSTSVLCNGDNNGSVTITPNGGTGNYTYNWSNATAGTPDSIGTTITGGTLVSVTVTDDSLCTAIRTITLQDPTGLGTIVTDSTLLSCAGDTNGTLTVTPQSGNQPFTFVWTPSVTLGSSDSIAIDLTSGITYKVVVTDGTGCKDSVLRNLTAPSAVLAQIFDSTSILCVGDTNGVLFGRGVSGTSPYAYAWKEVGSVAVVDTGISDSIAINLGAGSYRLIVTDNNGCVDSTEKSLIDPPTFTVAFTDSTVLTCAGPSNNGSLTVTPTGGTPGYLFAWGPGAITTGASDSIAINLSASILYGVTVTDANGCPAVVSDSLTDPSNFAANFSINDDPGCAGDSTGQLIVTPITGTPPFTYNWSHGTSGTSDSIRIELPGGVPIFVTVTDNGSCSDTVSFTLNDPLPLGSVFTDSSRVDCNGDTTGSLTVTPFNGSQPFSFTWTPSVTAGASDSIAIDLSGNTQYVVEIEDGNGCIIRDTASLFEPAAFSIAFTDSTSVQCNGDSSGSVTITPNGGTPGYSYAWTSSLGATVATTPDSIAIDLPSAEYFVTVTDLRGCELNDSINLVDPTPITAIVDTFNSSCGINDGIAIVTPSGGTPGYSFAWDSAGVALGVTSDTITGLFAGIYNVVVTDANNCPASFAANISDQGAPIISLDSKTNARCDNVCDGQISLNVISFNDTVQFVWSNGDTIEDITNLCDGVYTLVATDTAGCSATYRDTIINIDTLETLMSSSPLSCGLSVCDAEAKVVASGVTSPYSYQWSTALTDTIDSVTNLCAGTYIVTVTGANGCIGLDSAIIANPATFTLSSSGDSVSCNADMDGIARVDLITGGSAPFSYAWSTALTDTIDSVSGLGIGQYFVTVTGNDGCSDVDTVNIFEPDTISSSFFVVDADCGVANGSVTASPSGGNGIYSYIWPVGGVTTSAFDTFYTANIYDVTINDQKGCNNIIEFTVNNIGAPTITHDSIRNESCPGNCDGGIYVSVSGGLPIYLYQWTPGLTTDQDLDSVCPNIYTLRVTDQNSCVRFYTDTIEAADTLRVNASFISDASGTSSCDGSATVTVSGGVPTYSFAWTGGESTQTATALCVGMNYVTVTDQNGCFTIDSVQINASSTIILDSSNVNDNVCGATPCVGDVFVLAVGGTGALTYAWDNGDFGQLTTLRCAGFAFVTVTDAIGDTAVFSFRVTDIGGPVITKSKTDISCFSACDGVARVGVGFGTFTYLWPFDGSTNDSLDGLCPGSYEVRVTQTSTGCVTSDTINIVEPLQIASSFVPTESNCNTSDGQIIAIVSGGTGPYSYSWLDNSLVPLTPAQTTDTASNIGSGIYNVSVTDSRQCSQVIQTTLNDIGGPSIVLDSVNDVSCFGLCDGGIFVTTTGTGTLSYSWTGGSTNEDLTNSCAGPFTLQVSDVPGCKTFLQDTINDAQEIITSLNIVSIPSNSSTCDGEANISVSAGGIAPFSFSWSSGTLGSSANNLCTGVNFVTTTDVEGCFVIDTFNLNPGNVIVLDSIQRTNPNCNTCNGRINLFVSGGTAPYTYLWDNGDNTDSTTGRCSGIVEVTVTDNAGLSESFIFTLSDLPSPNFALNGDNVSCFGENDGKAYVTVLSGTPPITVTWLSISASGDTASNLPAGIYGVEVEDIFGCTAVDTIEIKQPTEIQASFTFQDANCGSSDGSVIAQITTPGGFSPYSYAWFDKDTLALSSQTTDTLKNVSSGVYFLSVTDNNSCSELFNANVNDVGGPTVTLDSLDNESCQGDCDGAINLTSSGTGTLVYNWLPGSLTTEDLSNLCAGNYIISVTDGLGCVSIRSYDVLPADSFDLNLVRTTNTTCESTFDGAIDLSLSGNASGFNYVWSGPSGFSASVLDLNGISIGDYNLTVTDQNGCFDTVSASVSFNTNIDVVAAGDTFLCSSANSIFISAIASSNASVKYTWYDTDGFIYGNLPIAQVTPKEGVTQYVVEAAAGLCVAYDTVQVTYSGFVRADAGPDREITKGDEIEIGGNPTSLLGDSTFWSPSTGILTSTAESNPLVSPSENTTYEVLVRDPFGCFAIDSVLVTVNPLEINDGFSPNGDGVNDGWQLPIVEDYPNILVDIYNRWGQLVFSSVGYTIPWDGRYKGKDLPVGTYYYVIDLNDNTVEDRFLTGPITIMR